MYICVYMFIYTYIYIYILAWSCWYPSTRCTVEKQRSCNRELFWLLRLLLSCNRELFCYLMFCFRCQLLPSSVALFTWLLFHYLSFWFLFAIICFFLSCFVSISRQLRLFLRISCSDKFRFEAKWKALIISYIWWIVWRR